MAGIIIGVIGLITAVIGIIAMAKSRAVNKAFFIGIALSIIGDAAMAAGATIWFLNNL